jgi:hypothetical protein
LVGLVHEVVKVKCLMYQSIIAKKPTRMSKHLGYKGPFGNRNKGVSMCQRITIQIKIPFNKCSGTVPIYPREAGPDHSDSCGTTWVEDAHLLC